MGTFRCHAEYYKNARAGEVDRKAQCDALCEAKSDTLGLRRGRQWDKNRKDSELLKSAMVGNIYYAALKYDKEVYALVIETSVDQNDWDNFLYKPWVETKGPAYYDCPKSILDILTETDNEQAVEWRKKCREQLKKGKGVEHEER